MLLKELKENLDYLDGSWVGLMLYEDKRDEISDFLHKTDMLNDMVDAQHAGQGDIQTMCKKTNMETVKSRLQDGGFKFEEDFDFYDMTTGSML